MALTERLKDDGMPQIHLSTQRNEQFKREDTESKSFCKSVVLTVPIMRETCQDEHRENDESDKKHTSTEWSLTITSKADACQSVIKDLLNIIETTCSGGEYIHMRHYDAPVTEYSFETKGDQTTTQDKFGQDMQELESVGMILQKTKTSARNQQHNEMHTNAILPNCQEKNSIQERNSNFGGNALTDNVSPKILRIFAEENKCLQDKEKVLKVGINDPTQGNKIEIHNLKCSGTFGLSALSKISSSALKKITLKKFEEDTSENETLDSKMSIFNQECGVLDKEKKQEITMEKLLRDDECSATCGESRPKRRNNNGLEVLSQRKFSWKKIGGGKVKKLTQKCRNPA